MGSSGAIDCGFLLHRPLQSCMEMGIPGKIGQSPSERWWRDRRNERIRRERDSGLMSGRHSCHRHRYASRMALFRNDCFLLAGYAAERIFSDVECRRQWAPSLWGRYTQR